MALQSLFIRGWKQLSAYSISVSTLKIPLPVYLLVRMWICLSCLATMFVVMKTVWMQR